MTDDWRCETDEPGPEDGTAPVVGPDQPWHVVAPLLRLRLRPVHDPAPWGPLLHRLLRAEVVVEEARAIIPVRRPMLHRWGREPAEIVALAGRQTLRQPLRWSSTSVAAGPDRGSILLIAGGGPCTNGIVTGLRSLRLEGLRFPAIVSVPNDHVAIVAVPPARSSVEIRRALVARLRRMQTAIDGQPIFGLAPHRRMLWCSDDGRLTIFGEEES